MGQELSMLWQQDLMQHLIWQTDTLGGLPALVMRGKIGEHLVGQVR